MQKFIILLCAVLLILSCRKEEQCPAEDFTGTYMGDAECMLGLTDQDDIRVVISKRDDKTLEVEFLGNVLVVDIKGCELEVDDNIALGTGTTGSLTVLDETLTLHYEQKVAGIVTEECDFLGMKI
ncbi:hypothetical protein [Portibacter marinus]|uniref:hypothetical protein n=1 Tax=Portibacter marinus TaxID=2898660 RepID=UPI001F295CAA|nr:hypothetical protein [Portibacter marinus]